MPDLCTDCILCDDLDPLPIGRIGTSGFQYEQLIRVASDHDRNDDRVPLFIGDFLRDVVSSVDDGLQPPVPTPPNNLSMKRVPVVGNGLFPRLSEPRETFTGIVGCLTTNPDRLARSKHVACLGEGIKEGVVPRFLCNLGLDKCPTL